MADVDLILRSSSQWSAKTWMHHTTLSR